jgi:general secretion pathway protein K
MAATFTRTSRTEVNLARNAMERFQAEALADAGIHLAAARLQQPIANGGWSIDGRVRSLQLEDGEVRILIADEAGKIDLNGAGVELLQALFRALGYDSAESATLADAIVDFRDGDHLHLLNGAEDEHYLAAGLSHDARTAAGAGHDARTLPALGARVDRPYPPQTAQRSHGPASRPRDLARPNAGRG